MNLYDYKSDRIMDPGTYNVAVKQVETVYSNGGTEGYKYTYITKEGFTITDTYWNTEKALPRLFYLANIADLEKEKMENFKPEDLIGKFIQIEVIEDGSFCNVGKVRRYKPTSADQLVFEQFLDLPF